MGGRGAGRASVRRRRWHPRWGPVEHECRARPVADAIGMDTGAGEARCRRGGRASPASPRSMSASSATAARSCTDRPARPSAAPLGHQMHAGRAIPDGALPVTPVTPAPPVGVGEVEAVVPLGRERGQRSMQRPGIRCAQGVEHQQAAGTPARDRRRASPVGHAHEESCGTEAEPGSSCFQILRRQPTLGPDRGHGGGPLQPLVAVGGDLEDAARRRDHHRQGAHRPGRVRGQGIGRQCLR